MPTSAWPRSRIAAPPSTSSRPSTCGLVAACIRDSVSGKRTTPIAAVSASAEPPSTRTPASDVEDVHCGLPSVRSIVAHAAQVVVPHAEARHADRADEADQRERRQAVGHRGVEAVGRPRADGAHRHRDEGVERDQSVQRARAGQQPEHRDDGGCRGQHDAGRSSRRCSRRASRSAAGRQSAGRSNDAIISRSTSAIWR